MRKRRGSSGPSGPREQKSWKSCSPYPVADRFEACVHAICTNVHAGARIADIGAGPAPIKDALERKGYRYWGFDLAPEREDIVQWDVLSPPPEFLVLHSFQCVVMMECLEHLFDLPGALENAKSLLCDEGLLLITVPNPMWSRGRISHVLRGWHTYFGPDFLGIHHVANWQPWVLEHVLVSHGFRPFAWHSVGSRTVLRPPLRPLKSLFLRFFHRLFCAVIESMDEAARGGTLMVISELKPLEDRESGPSRARNDAYPRTCAECKL